MSTEANRTPLRALLLGCTSFAGLDSIAWEDQTIPNIPDYDLVVVSVPHISEGFLTSVNHDYMKDLRASIVRFLHSGGRMVVLVSRNFAIERSKRFPGCVRSNFWCPIGYGTVNENGRSIVWTSEHHKTYLQKMSSWSFYFTIPQSCVTDELEKFYGYTSTTRYKVPLEAYIENRYGKVLAGSFDIEVSRESFAHKTGTTVLLPLIDHMSPEEALADILHGELGISSERAEPDWASRIEMPHVTELVRQVDTVQTRIARDQKLVGELHTQIHDINAFRRLLYSTGPELEAIVKRSLELLGATVSPSKYAQEEYILEHDGQEFLMEVKGVGKSISLTHLRQLNDYLLKYEEDTGKVCKGVLFGNAWRNLPPEVRGAKNTPEFPDNVIKRAGQWGVSLVSSKAFFEAFVKTLENPDLSKELLGVVTGSSGVAFPPDESAGVKASEDDVEVESHAGRGRGRRGGRRGARKRSTG